MKPFILEKEKTGLLVIDVQDRLFPLVERQRETLMSIQKVIKGFQALNIAIEATEQYPEKMGGTVEPIRALLSDEQCYFSKTTFSCCADSSVKEHLLSLPITQWVIVGIEAHVCVLQTARDLLMCDREVVVLNDAISSRSIFDYSTAIAEMRDMGIRVSSVETVLFELMRDSKVPEFKAVSALIK